MDYLYTSKEILKIEEQSCKAKNLSLTELMYQAGYVLTKDFLKRLKPNVKDNIIIIANSGNNGGDGLVMYQELKKMGYKVSLFLLGNVSSASEAFTYYYNKINLDEIKKFHDNKTMLSKADFIIDAIFGFGLDRDITGIYFDVIQEINNVEALVYSIDIPSGINPNNGLIFNTAVKADFTGVLGNLKLGNILSDALDYHGELKLLNLDMVDSYSEIAYLDYQDIRFHLKRNHNSYKYSYHKIAYIGSSVMPGAINLAAMAGLRSGVGLAVVVYEKAGLFLYPEIIYKTFEEIFSVDSYDAFVFGPGITDGLEVYQKIFNDIIFSKKPVVLDAGGLQYLDLKEKYENVIITPHIKEFSDLIKVDKMEILHNPFKYIKTLTDIGITVLLKGVATIISDSEKTFVLQAKNPGLATAGTGDVLAGMISGFFQERRVIDAALKGFALHARAATLAREEFTETSMIASDLIKKIPDAIKQVEL